MLGSLRDAAKTWVAKLLLLLLILSFAVWGISDQILGGGGGNVVIEAGETSVTAQQYRLAYDRQLAIQSQQFGTRLTREQARLLGIDNAVRARMVGSAVLDEQARVMGLGLSEDRLAGLIAEDQAFQGLDGRFDRSQFRLILREVGMTEADYIVDREQAAIRQQIIEAVADGITMPDTFLEAVHRYQGQTRDVSFVEIDSSALTPPGTPDQAALEAFFEENKDDYRAPEYRTIQYVLLTPESIADPGAIDTETVRAEYEDNRARYAQPETRTIQQLVFADEDSAQAARERILAGQSFEDAVADTGRTMADVSLGTLERADVPDAAVAEAAFGLAEAGDISDVVDGAFGSVLVRVTEIQPERVQPFDEVADGIREELAALEARDVLLDIHDGYEDARAGGSSMAEAAATQRIAMETLPAIDANGNGEDGQPVEGIPEAGALLQASFAAEIGEESRPLDAGREGFLWYEVTGIDPERDRTLDEVRDRVIADWQAAQIEDALDAAADAVAQALRDGGDPSTIAADNGYRADVKFGLSRSGEDADFGATALAAVFGVGPRGVDIAEGATGDRRLVFRVDQITNPLGGAESIDPSLRANLGGNLADDLLNQMVNRLQSEFPVTLYPTALERALDAGT
ncbi:peptidylprolyl isomerase [Oceaniradius stylonematis]|uniref:Parvulin-like PPIase n=1 Tax=Oceaniradius stylonematis TaxID=2184161 RepID=A0A3A8AFQ1_9HYPH|nr:SurA N-terminal domain-containing protein [Oceaniradius stylonematis]RKF08218.1 peptidylprolyl isomerase [Oceaniradius stylonematis]RNC95018.1 MAG: peptidylprolyl isomerase [Oricola sp.]